ncbi:MAG: DUF192 domain-containing protein [Treponema sp.]|nr:DUF192 domain-containing protein [Treponema sp.]
MNSRECGRAVVLCIALAGCNAALASCGTEDGAQKLPALVLQIKREADESPVSLTVEVAASRQERATGLMHRRNLPDGRGMIFVFDRDEQLSFYMRNTLIPLSIAYIASDGRIAEIRDMHPLDLTPVVSARSVRYALEVPQGWFARENVRVGDLVMVDVLAKTNPEPR